MVHFFLSFFLSFFSWRKACRLTVGGRDQSGASQRMEALYWGKGSLNGERNISLRENKLL